MTKKKVKKDLNLNFHERAHDAQCMPVTLQGPWSFYLGYRPIGRNLMSWVGVSLSVRRSVGLSVRSRQFLRNRLMDFAQILGDDSVSQYARAIFSDF